MPHRFSMCWPIGSSEMDGDGTHVTYNTWGSGRMSDCRINGVLVGEMAFRKFRHDRRKRHRQMTPQRLWWNLRRYIR